MGLTLYHLLSWAHTLSVIGFILLVLWAGIQIYSHSFSSQPIWFTRLFSFSIVVAFGSGTVIAAFSPLELTHPLNLIKIIGALLATGLSLIAFNRSQYQQPAFLFWSSSLVILILLLLVSIPSISIFGI